MTRRTSARVQGAVQGVGFRPYVYRLANEEGLAGYVLNDERGVLLDVEGDTEAVERFVERLAAEAPPLAAIESVAWTALPPTGGHGFRILDSSATGEPSAPVTPDAATCDDCLAELSHPGDRRFRYPFINCTNCGPRFTIVRSVPYDRALTTMAGFAMCARCQAEYDDPADRRFHAQPNACPDCGPQVRLGDAVGDEAMRAAAALLLDGAIVAVKGVGGYHLACRAEDEAVVARLRARKHREDRPFAVMAPDLDAARTLVALDQAEAALLTGRDRPIVLAARRADAPVAAAVAPRSAELGVMLPYSPLHHLLTADTATTLVMTSGNVSDEPIAYVDDDARERLAGIADHVLAHDRPIRTRTDDSVVRAVGGRPLMLRRSRGHVPRALALPVATRDLLACGAELKSTFCLAKGTRAWPGHHIGDLRNEETLRSFAVGVAHFERLFAVAPEVVAHDLHPDYLSTTYALAREEVAHVGVQHHHAHLAAVLAEHGERGPAIGAIYDGTGYGLDGTVWGGELLAGGLDGFERAGHLWPVRLPGGDHAVRQPWRMACAWLVEVLGAAPSPLPGIDPRTWHAVAELSRTGLAAPVTTSMGRLFDAVAALCGVRTEVSYEGQAAVELEAISDRSERGAYPLDVAGGLLDARGTVAAVALQLAAGVAPAVVGARFHRSVARATARACADAAGARGLDTVVLAGGVWQNRLLLELTLALLEQSGLRVLVPERLPPNDGAISFGQAAVAAAQHKALRPPTR
ncbi:MAG TPA: carbamoyltransferase HypF [Solirubrobacteraceae bacterium]|nr:carbamoyltransferase HypF [Solirubrobacteraceae bacterium]